MNMKKEGLKEKDRHTKQARTGRLKIKERRIKQKRTETLNKNK